MRKLASELPPDYVERVYAGVLGKMIGVYLGRPFEGWSYDRIIRELGEIEYYVHEKRNVPLIVTDDDLSGTFTFLRALADYGYSPEITPEQIGQSWLNYIIERMTILWWGGMGHSTEHTAYLRLKRGITAPQSGSIVCNGKVVAEQIGAQIFIDGWAMVAPGDPEFAADLARRTASVSHDGEAVYGAQVIAAMESQAFIESDRYRLISTALGLIPNTSVIYRLINDVLECHAREQDWRKGREWLAAHYGYDKYGGNCHIVPNHGLIILSLLYGDDDFGKTLKIVNTSGWDTDCNSGNVGCLLGIKNGLVGLESGRDWRSPVADRLYLPTADGGRAITDAVTETYHVVNTGRRLAGLNALTPKNGARFHFSLPGSVQGFTVDDSFTSQNTTTLENTALADGTRALAIRYQNVFAARVSRVSTPTFIPPEAISMSGYALIASPTLYAGQTVAARLLTDAQNNVAVRCALYISVYGDNDALTRIYSDEITLQPGQAGDITWTTPDTDNQPIAQVGIETRSPTRADGTLYVDYLTWRGTPEILFTRPTHSKGHMWERAWVKGVDNVVNYREHPFYIVQNEGRGVLSCGTADWKDYEVSTTIVPHLSRAAGLAIYVGGMRRYYAVLLSDNNTARLVKTLHSELILAETAIDFHIDQPYAVALSVRGNRVRASVNEHQFADVVDTEPFTSGGIALICEEGCVAAEAIRITPLNV
jgi:ADP-ribosylglycohydrolase